MNGLLCFMLLVFISLINDVNGTEYTVSSTSSGTFSSPAFSYPCNAYQCAPYTCGNNTCYNSCYQACYNVYDRRDLLTAESGHRVVLVVQSSGGGCDDRLEAYDGNSMSATKIFDQCCNGYTGLTISTGNQMFFRFTNNGDGDAVHFTIRYFGFDPTGNPTAGQTIIASQTPLYGSLYPDNFPAKYTANEDKFWILKAPCQSYILTGALFFSDFNNCNDKLILRDGRYTTSSVLRQYCTPLTSNPDTATFTSTQQYIYVEMRLTSGVAYYGFGLKYTWTENPGFTNTTPESCFTDTTPESLSTNTTTESRFTDTTPESRATNTTTESRVSDTTPESRFTNTTREASSYSIGISLTAFSPFTDLGLQTPSFGNTYQRCVLLAIFVLVYS